MKQINYDLEVIYIYKLYYFFTLLLLFLPLNLVLTWRFGQLIGLTALGLSFVFAYFLMMQKKNFPVPDKKVTAQKMAKEITQQPSPLAVSRFSSQLYFYFNEKRQAIRLLEKYKDTQDTLLSATLADILLREGRLIQALKTIRENPHYLSDPLLLFILGQIYQQFHKWEEAIRIYELSLSIARKTGFPQNGANRFTHFILSLSYTANIHHSLGDCYSFLEQYPQARKHYFLGNIRLFDISLWKKFKIPRTKTA